MNLKYCLNSVYNCLPLSRLKLLEDVILYRNYGEIHKIWLSCGHVFVTLDKGRKLLTFDSKTADLIQDEEREGCLDLDMKYPVTEIIAWPPNAVIIVLENGDLLHWVFGQDYKWRKQAELYLRKSVGALVMSVCLNVTQSSLYWCEQTNRDGTDTYTLYKRPVKQDEETSGCLKFGPTTTLIKNCYCGKVYPIGHGCVFVSSCSDVCLLMSTLTGSIDVIINKTRSTVPDVNIHTPVTYSQIVLVCVSQLYKMKSSPSVLQTCYIHSSQKLLLLHSDATIVSVTRSTETDDPPVQLDVNDVNLSAVKSLIPLRQCVGLVMKSEIRVFSLKTGVFVCSLSIDDHLDIAGVCENMLGNQQMGVYTQNGLYIIQKERCNRQMDEQSIIKSGHYQSPAIQLSYLEKLRKTSYDLSSSQAIEQLKAVWQTSSQHHPTSKLAEIVDPYLTEYWKLDNMLQDKCKHANMIPNMDVTSVREEVDTLLDAQTKMSNSGRQAQLLLLSEWHPREVLDSLLERFDLNSDELSTSQSHKWQCILAPETANLTGSGDIPVPLFELLAHLLYKHKPGHLIKFLHQGQKAWDKKLGVSAFIRRKQNLLIYERALKCISEPCLSSDVETAILVHVHILLTSEIEGCFLKAVRMLLKYKKWSEVIELYKEKKDNSRHNILVYQMIITALTRNDVLSKFADEIFPLMPSINCTDLMQKNGHSPSVLCTDQDGISMKTVKPFLIDSIKQTVKQNPE